MRIQRLKTVTYFDKRYASLLDRKGIRYKEAINWLHEEGESSFHLIVKNNKKVNALASELIAIDRRSKLKIVRG